MIPLPCGAAWMHACVVAFSRVAVGRGVGSVQRCSRTTQPPSCAKRWNVCRRSSIVLRHTDLRQETRVATHIKGDKAPERTKFFLFWRCSSFYASMLSLQQNDSRDKGRAFIMSFFSHPPWLQKPPLKSEWVFLCAWSGWAALQDLFVSWEPTRRGTVWMHSAAPILSPHHPNCPWERAWKTKRDKWDCYAIRYKAIIKKKKKGGENN